MPGYIDTPTYPPTPDLAKAKALTRGTTRTAVLYTCYAFPCAQSAQILTRELAAIGIRLLVKSFPITTLFARETRPGEPFDIGYRARAADYPNPAGMLNPILEKGPTRTGFGDPTFQR